MQVRIILIYELCRIEQKQHRQIDGAVQKAGVFMIGLHYEILRYIQWTPRSKEEICRRINRFRFKKIPSYLIGHMIDELEYAGLIEEFSQAEIDKMLAGEDPDDIEIVSSPDFIGKYGLTGTSGFSMMQELREDSRRFYVPLLITAGFSLDSLICSIISLLCD